MLGTLMEAGFGPLQYHTTATIMNDVIEMLNDRGPNAFKSPSPNWKTEKLSADDTVDCNQIAVTICHILADNDDAARRVLTNHGNDLTVDTFHVIHKERKIDVTFTSVFTTHTIFGIWMILYQGSGKNRVYHMYPVYINGTWYPTEYPYSSTLEKRGDELQLTLQPY